MLVSLYGQAKRSYIWQMGVCCILMSQLYAHIAWQSQTDDECGGAVKGCLVPPLPRNTESAACLRNAKRHAHPFI